MLPSRIVVAELAQALPGRAPLTVAFVPTGMNAGVGTSPWAVRSTPARASPSVAVTVKLIARFRARFGTIRAHTRALFDDTLESGWWDGVPRRYRRGHHRRSIASPKE